MKYQVVRTENENTEYRGDQVIDVKASWQEAAAMVDRLEREEQAWRDKQTHYTGSSPIFWIRAVGSAS